MFNHKHAVRDQGSSVIVGINKKITFFFFLVEVKKSSSNIHFRI